MLTEAPTQNVLTLTLPTEPTDLVEQALQSAAIVHNIVNVPLDAIDYNPYQTRDADDDDIPDLAANIQRDGLNHPPTARPHPEVGGRYQLAAGHRRFAAYIQLHTEFCMAHPDWESPWRTIPLDVRELDNAQMFRICISENDKRRPLGPIEKAKAMRRAIDEFGLTQEQAGAEFNLTQSAASHLLSMLDKLPPTTHALVDSGAVPQRLARVANAYSLAAPEIVERVLTQVAEETDDKERAFEDALSAELAQNGKILGISGQLFSLTDEVKVDPALLAEAQASGLTETDSLPACVGCRFNILRNRQNVCVRVSCNTTKRTSIIMAQVRAHAEALNIKFAPTADGLESLEALFENRNWEYGDWARKLLGSKNTQVRGLLRVVPFTTEATGYNAFTYIRKNAIGNEYALLYTTKLDKLLKLVPIEADEEEGDGEDDGEAERTRAREQARLQAEEQQRQELRRTNTELVRLAAQAMGAKLFEQPQPFAPMLLVAVQEHLDFDTVQDTIDPSSPADQIDLDELAHEVKAKVLARFVLEPNLDARLTVISSDARESDVRYTNYKFAPTPLVAKTLYELLTNLGVFVPAQIVGAAAPQKPQPKASKPAKGKSKTKAKAKGSKPAPKPGASTGKPTKRAKAKAGK